MHASVVVAPTRRVSILGTLEAAFSSSRLSSHLRFVLLDLVWRMAWFIASAALVLLFGFTLMSQLASFHWEGPDLGAGNPMMVLAALRTFWETFGATILWALGLMFGCSFLIWISLEAFFRGGRGNFWIYAGTSLARYVFLLGTSAVFGLLALQGEAKGVVVIGIVFLSALIWATALLETAIRRNALEVLGVDLAGAAAVVGALLVLETALGVLVWGPVVAALVFTSGGAQLALALALAALAGGLWMVAHSYLIAVRYAAVDLMRQYVVGH